MNKADIYLRETLLEILEDGQVDKDPRPKWEDGSPAHSKFITQKIFQYDISKGEFPITTLRPTALKGAWYDIEAIYLKQTNVLEDMHKSIHSWWRDFVVETYPEMKVLVEDGRVKNPYWLTGNTLSSLGQTYGHTVKRYKLVDKLLKGLEENPFGRRHKISLWQEQQMIDDPKALEPCAGMTMWSVREENDHFYETKSRFIDITLVQRSQDFVVTSSINSIQYTMLAMMVCNHLTFKTGIKHEVGKLLHIVQNCHVYLRHMDAVSELLDRKPTGKQPKIELICEPKLFHLHTIEDFKFSGLEGIEKINSKLEIAV